MRLLLFFFLLYSSTSFAVSVSSGACEVFVKKDPSGSSVTSVNIANDAAKAVFDNLIGPDVKIEFNGGVGQTEIRTGKNITCSKVELAPGDFLYECIVVLDENGVAQNIVGKSQDP